MLQNLLGQVEDITGQSKQSRGGAFETFDEDDFDTFNGGNLQEGQYVDLAVYTVEAQTQYNVGFGKADRPENQGRFFAAFDDGAGAEVSGKVRIVTRTAQDKRPDTDVSGISTARLNTNVNDRRLQYPLPEIVDTPRVGEDSKIVLQFKLKPGSAGVAIDQAASTILLDVTEYS